MPVDHHAHFLRETPLFKRHIYRMGGLKLSKYVNLPSSTYLKSGML